MSARTAEGDAAFCPTCDVSIDLHDGPDTCGIAMRKAALVDLFYGASIRVTSPASTQGDPS